MEIISLTFALLAIFSVFIYYLISEKYRILFIALLSCIFIGAFSSNLLIYVLIFTLFNYIIGLKLNVSPYKKSLFRSAIIINLLQIIVFKYYDFSINPLFDLPGIESGISKLTEIIKPVGISYFTLQGIGYLININMGWEKPERNFVNFLLYIVFFPKFLSGPVERSNHLLPQFRNPSKFLKEEAVRGLGIAFGGFVKKILIADQLAGFINGAYSGLDILRGEFVLILIIIQPLYLYFDFSGYTDIAIGFSKMFGFDLIQNFNRPFLSENVSTFWKRFHISLSSWFNDYIFKQTSFRLRKYKLFATILALLLTWVLFGIWHGAGWNFMLLGFIQAVAIIYEFYTKKLRIQIFKKIPDILSRWSSRIITYLFFGCSLVFFFSPDLRSALHIFGNLTENGTGAPQITSLTAVIFGLAFAILFLIFEILQNDYIIAYQKLINIWSKHRILRIVIYYFLIILMLTQLGGSSSFVYQIF